MPCYTVRTSAHRRDILVVDDDDSIRAVLDDALDDAGFVVRTAGTTAAALQAVDDRTPDVVILDMRMPDDGPRFKGELLRRSLGAAIVAMSASIEGRTWATSMNVPFLAKPFQLEDVLAAIEHALAGERP